VDVGAAKAPTIRRSQTCKRLGTISLDIASALNRCVVRTWQVDPFVTGPLESVVHDFGARSGSPAPIAVKLEAASVGQRPHSSNSCHHGSA
jgi:hypothetical protein